MAEFNPFAGLVAKPAMDRRCRYCGTYRPMDQFRPRKDSFDGLNHKCRKCEASEEDKRRRKRVRDLTTEATKARRSAEYQRNRERRIQSAQRRYRELVTAWEFCYKLGLDFQNAKPIIQSSTTQPGVPVVFMTINEALAVQERQLAHYGRTFPELPAIARAANKIPEGIDRDAPIDMIRINEMIPRGCALGWLLSLIHI